MAAQADTTSGKNVLYSPFTVKAKALTHGMNITGSAGLGKDCGLLCNMDQLLHTAMEVVGGDGTTAAAAAAAAAAASGGDCPQGGGGAAGSDMEGGWPRCLMQEDQPVDLTALDGIDLDFPPLEHGGGGASGGSAGGGGGGAAISPRCQSWSTPSAKTITRGRIGGRSERRRRRKKKRRTMMMMTTTSKKSLFWRAPPLSSLLSLSALTGE